jgi:hypothetical protein
MENSLYEKRWTIGYCTAPVLGVRAILQNVCDLILQLIRDIILFTVRDIINSW